MSTSIILYFQKTIPDIMSQVSGEQYSFHHSFSHHFMEEMRNDPDILAVYQYGSSLTGTSFRDIDICIISKCDECTDFLPSFFRYSGTYAGSGDIPLDITLFSLLPLYIRIQVIHDGRILFVQDREKLFDLIRMVNREWDDYEPSYRILIS